LIKKEKEHIPNIICDPYKKFKGNMLFASKNSFIGHTLSRRDDIITIMYMLVFLVNGKIPNNNKNNSVQMQFEAMKRMKVNVSAERFCKGIAIHLAPVLTYVYSIEFK
jgi:hypothetical protein